MRNSDQGDCFWPLSKKLFKAILSDQISDRFVSELIWERLGYVPSLGEENLWLAGKCTPKEWIEKFPNAPEVIASRTASVFLTRSIPKHLKQLLKQRLDFGGYRIGELYPRRTRRATSVNWLLAWMEQSGLKLSEKGIMPDLLDVPLDPTMGHPGDRPIE